MTTEMDGDSWWDNISESRWARIVELFQAAK